MITLLLSVILIVLIVFGVLIYRHSKNTADVDDIEYGSNIDAETYEKMCQDLTEKFVSKHKAYVDKKNTCEKVDKLKSVWQTAAEDDPVAIRNMKDIELSLVIVKKQLENMTNELNDIVLKIFNETDILEKSRSTNFILYRDLINWKLTHSGIFETKTE